MVDVGTGGHERRPAVRGVVPSREEVAADVRRIVGSCRSRGDFLRLDTPAIDHLLALEGRARDDGPDLLARAIAAVDRDQYRQFLEALLPFPFEEGERWPSLGPSRRGPGRGDLAATVFGLDTWDGCTRPSATLDGRSRRDWAELHLASALIRVATDTIGDDAPDAAGPRGGSQRRRSTATGLVAALVGVVAVAAAVAVVTTRSSAEQSERDRNGRGSRREAAATTVPDGVLGEQCVTVGELAPVVAARSDAAQVAATLEAVYGRAGGEAELGCALAPAGLWEGIVVQELESGEAELPAALVLSDAENGVVLSGAQWGSYKRIGSGDGGVVDDIAGPPTAVVDRSDGGTEIVTARGVVAVGESRNAPHFWIPAPFVEFWRAHPELGRPTGNPMAPGIQTFEHGTAELELGVVAEPSVRIVEDPGAELPGPAERRNAVLRQMDGTAWFVDDADRRRWIGTGSVWECLTADLPVVRDVPGYAIATLAAGGHAGCSQND